MLTAHDETGLELEWRRRTLMDCDEQHLVMRKLPVFRALRGHATQQLIHLQVGRIAGGCCGVSVKAVQVYLLARVAEAGSYTKVFLARER